MAVIQISLKALEYKTYVIHTLSWNRMPPNLKHFLESNKVIKAGNRIVSCDVNYLRKDWMCTIDVSSCIKLNHMCFQKGKVSDKRVSLKFMCETILGYTLNKDISLRTSLWNADRLTKEQIKYAALDAYASLLIAEALVRMPNKPFWNSNDENSPICISPVLSQQVSPILDVPTNPRATTTTVLLDIFHAMKRITETMPAKHPGLLLFSQDLRDRIFITNEEDKKNVDIALKTVGSSFDIRLRTDPGWIFKRVRRVIPPPNILEQRLKDLCYKYKLDNFKDCTYGHLIKPETERQVKLFMKHIRRGCVSDPVGLPLYQLKGKDKLGLKLYKCLRGTNTVELWHQFIEMR